MNNESKIQLIPDWRSYFWYYLAGILLISVFGAGIIVLWFVHKNRNSRIYEIHNHYIQENSTRGSRKLELVHIEKVSVSRNWTEKQFGTGTVRLAGNVSVIELYGIKNPHEMAEVIDQAVAVAKKKLYTFKQKKRRKPDHEPGTLDRMDYLTGLWQQGLISNEDYRKEKKHFE